VNVLIIVNGPAYGSELPFNGLRLAGTLARRDGVQLRVFLMGDAVVAALDGQQVPDGYYHLDRMVRGLLRRDGEVGCCGTSPTVTLVTTPSISAARRRNGMRVRRKRTCAREIVGSSPSIAS
jgi:uncharacterized protein involved in oxidation of intracellular sulfur